MKKALLATTTAVFVAGLILLSMVSSGTANAATLTVNQIDSSGIVDDISPGNGVCEATPGEGDCTLRAAVTEAYALAGDDVISLPFGFFNFVGPAFAGSPAGGNLSIVGEGEGATFVTGLRLPAANTGDSISLSAMALEDIIVSTELGDLIVEEARLDAAAGSCSFDVTGGQLTVTDSQLVGCSVSTSSTLQITGSEINDGTVGALGGGTCSGGSVEVLNGSATIRDTTFTGNAVALSVEGGGVALTNVSFDDNTVAAICELAADTATNPAPFVTAVNTSITTTPAGAVGCHANNIVAYRLVGDAASSDDDDTCFMSLGVSAAACAGVGITVSAAFDSSLWDLVYLPTETPIPAAAPGVMTIAPNPTGSTIGIIAKAGGLTHAPPVTVVDTGLNPATCGPAPAAISVGLDPVVLDLCAGPGIVTVTVVALDGQSDLELSSSEFVSETEAESVIGTGDFAGALLSETISYEVEFPQYGEAGEWQLDDFAVIDALDNEARYGPLGANGDVPGDTLVTATSCADPNAAPEVETVVAATTVDVCASDGAVSVQVTTSDVDMDLNDATMTLQAPDLSVLLSETSTFDGGLAEETVTIDFTVPRFATAGIWSFSSLEVTDLAEKSTTYFPPNLPGANSIEVTSCIPAVPLVTSVDVLETSIDVCAASDTVTIDVSTADNDADLAAVVIKMFSPSGPPVTIFDTELLDEGLLATTTQFLLTVPQFAAEGSWDLHVAVTDRQDQTTTYGTDVGLPPVPGDTSVAVTSCTNPSLPVLTTTSMSPGYVGTCNGPAAVFVEIVATDVNMDLDTAFVGIEHLTNPTTLVSASATFAGVATEESVTVELTLPQGSAQGDWKLVLVELSDLNGGSRQFDVSDINALVSGPQVLEVGCANLEADTASLVAPNSVTIDVLANDPARDDVVSVTPADGAQGTTSVDGSFMVTYTPGVSSSTTDQFSYEACTVSSCETTVVDVTIAPPKCLGATATLWGGFGDDELIGTPGADVIVGFAGADNITAGAGNDLVCAGDGNDTADLGPGLDRMKAGAGDDIVEGGDDRDVILGEAGVDQLFGDAGRDTLYGGDGNDMLDGGPDTDVMRGQGGDDELFTGTSGNDRIVGGEGNDILDARLTSGSTRLIGDAGDDVFFGSPQLDRMWGFGGADTMHAGGFNDLLRGGDDDDIIFGEDGKDTLDGGAGDDELYGGAGGADKMVGGDGVDLCDGGPGNLDFANASCETILGVP